MTAPNHLTAPTRRRARAAAALLAGLLLLAQAAPALAISDDPVLRRMDNVLEENNRLRDEAWKARKHGKDAARQAQEALDASDERLERTRAEALAHVAGVSPAQVETLRRDGKSWGQAAGELGVHPGFLGVGKAPLYQSLPASKAPAKKKALKAGKKAGRAEKTLSPKAKPAKKAAKAAAPAKKKAKAK